jgi:hypothetical protein
VSLGLDGQGNSIPWEDVFGIDGLTIRYMAFEIGINWTTTPIPLPEIGIAASIELPVVLADLIGMDEGVPVSFAMKISTTSFCLSIQIGDEPEDDALPENLPRAISLLEGEMYANYAELTVAPLGCSIATYEIDPGVKIGFYGHLFGVDIRVKVNLAIAELEMQVLADIGAFDLGPLHFDRTYLDLLVSGTDPLNSHLYLFAGMALDLPAGRTMIDIDIIFEFNGPNGPRFLIDGNIDRLVVVPDLVEVRQATVQAFVEPASLRLYMNVTGDVKLLGANVKGAFRLDVDESGLYEVRADLNANINWGTVGVEGSFNFAYQRGGFPNLRFAGVVAVAGQKLAQATGQLDEYGFTLNARADIANVFRGELVGQIVFCNPGGARNITIPNRDGVMVTAQPGDFYFSASASIDFGIASGSGTLKVGQSAISTQQPTLAPCPTYAVLPTRDLNVDAIAAASRNSLPGASTTVSPSTTRVATTVGALSTTIAPATTSTVARATTTTIAPATTSTVARATTTTVAPATTTTVAQAPAVQRELTAAELATLVARQANAAEASAAPTTVVTATTVPVTIPESQSTLFKSVSVPRVSFAAIRANGQLNLAPITGAVDFVGDIDSTGNLAAKVKGNLTMGGMGNAALDAAIVFQKGGDWSMNLNFVGNLASNLATVNFNGVIGQTTTVIPAAAAQPARSVRTCVIPGRSFDRCPAMFRIAADFPAIAATPEQRIKNGMRYRFTGVARLNVPGVDTSGNFSFSNYPEDAGVRATAGLVAGPSFARMNGSLTVSIDPTGRGFLAWGNGSAAISGIANAYANFEVTNLWPRWNYAPEPRSVCSEASSVNLNGTVYCTRAPAFAFASWFNIFGLSFSMGGNFDSNGAFRFAALSPAGGGVATKTVYLGCWWGNLYAVVNYQVQIVVQSGQPNIDISGFGSLLLKHHSWWPGEYSERQIASATFRGTVNPTTLKIRMAIDFIIRTTINIDL